ncbi:MAG: sigma-54 interaction domain-containing protein [Pseudomonadales bacterium]
MPVTPEQAQKQHQLILDAAGEGIYGIDADGRATFANAAAIRLLGWSEDQLAQTLLHDLHHHSHADGSPYPREECPIYAALRDGEVHRVTNEVFWHVDGHCIPVDYTSTPIVEQGQIQGAVVVFRDVSERLRNEREREMAFEEINRLTQALALERDYLRDEINTSSAFGDILGDSEALGRTLAQIDAVADTPATALILGESGVGKELIARAIHDKSQRADQPLVKVNCASIPDELFESEFFGHVKGAFTGAHRDRVGRLQLANQGTLFLDEVGEIPLPLQGKLLRALQEQEFERVGEDKTVRVDVRVIAATNRNLEQEVQAGRFREDLYYRLSVFPLHVPPLRERVADIEPLALHFIELHSKQLRRPTPQLSRAQLQRLIDHDWPGNIRELKNVLERAVILSQGPRLALEVAFPESRSEGGAPSERKVPAAAEEKNEESILTEQELRNLEADNILKALRLSKGKVSGKGGAAERLGLKPSTLSYRIKILGIEA